MLEMPFGWLGLGWYVIIGFILGRNWYRYFQAEISLSPDQVLLSWIALGVTTILWPFTLPFTYLELVGKYNQSLDEASAPSDLRSRHLGPTQPSVTGQQNPNPQSQSQPRQMPRHANFRRDQIKQRLQQHDHQQ